MDREVLDDRVGKQRPGDLSDPGVVDRLIDLKFEVLPLAHRGHAGVAEPGERAEDRLTLRVEDLRLQDDVDDDPRHGRQGRASADGLQPTRRARGSDLAGASSWAASRPTTVADQGNCSARD